MEVESLSHLQCTFEVCSTSEWGHLEADLVSICKETERSQADQTLLTDTCDAQSPRGGPGQCQADYVPQWSIAINKRCLRCCRLTCLLGVSTAAHVLQHSQQSVLTQPRHLLSVSFIPRRSSWPRLLVRLAVLIDMYTHCSMTNTLLLVNNQWNSVAPLVPQHAMHEHYCISWDANSSQFACLYTLIPSPS